MCDFLILTKNIQDLGEAFNPTEASSEMNFPVWGQFWPACMDPDPKHLFQVNDFVADPDPHHFGKLDPDPHQSEKGHFGALGSKSGNK
jgi:hypothetical protein